MSNATVTFMTSVVTIPANSSVSYGSSGASPSNFYQAAITATSGAVDGNLTVTNGWAVINNGAWNGPTWLVTNSSGSAMSGNLQVVAIGPETSPVKIAAM